MAFEATSKSVLRPKQLISVSLSPREQEVDNRTLDGCWIPREGPEAFDVFDVLTGRETWDQHCLERHH